MREIVLDTETTGLNPLQGDRVIEIGCVEINNLLPTGNFYHCYFNPEGDVPSEAIRVHGITNEFLSDKPLFSSEVDVFLEFISDSPLVIHNAAFDVGFLNSELSHLGFPQIPINRSIDTVALARKKFPGSPASLDFLCKKFNIDASKREKHGALLDAQLLAEVYLELRGGRQSILEINVSGKQSFEQNTEQSKTRREPRKFIASDAEISLHNEFLEQIKNPLWKRA